MKREETTDNPESPPPVEKMGWRALEGCNKCLLNGRESEVVTSEMEARKVEVSRQVLSGVAYITYYDSQTEVYWIDKCSVPADDG